MADPAKTEQLKQLEARIDAVKRAAEPEKRHQDNAHSQAHLAWRMVIELVVGLMIGFGIGLGLDVLFGTQPIFMVLFILLGFAAGVRTMMRSAKEIQERRIAEAAESAKEKE